MLEVIQDVLSQLPFSQGLGTSADTSATNLATTGRGIPGMGRYPEQCVGCCGTPAAPAGGTLDLLVFLGGRKGGKIFGCETV